MCYDINTNLEAQLSRASRKLDLRAIKEIKENLAPLADLPIYHTTGFSHPKLLIYTDRSPWSPQVSTWGLVPHWVKDKKELKELWDEILNARGETIFEKPSFRESARHNRCLIYINGFYEHHHLGGGNLSVLHSSKKRQTFGLGRTLERMDRSGNIGDAQYFFHIDHQRK